MAIELSLFEARRSPYYILAPDYRHSSAGIRNLHYLCHVLNEYGYEAYIAGATITSVHLRTPLLDRQIVERHFLSGRTPIAVYPETITGNPLSAPFVARWLLNVPGHLGGDTEFSKEDLIFRHLPWCLPEGMSGDPLYIPSVDTRIFNNENNPDDTKRSGFCRYANKYLAHGGKIKPEHESFQSLGHEVTLTPEQIAAILRRSEALYCYERSAIIQEAMACGCPVLAVESDYWKIQPFEVSEPGIEIDHGPNSLNKAKADIGGTSETLRAHQRQALGEIQQFAKQTQARALEVIAAKHKPTHLLTPHDFWLLNPDERQQQHEAFKRSWIRSDLFSTTSEILSKEQGNAQYHAWLANKNLHEIDLEYFSEHVRSLWRSHPLFEFVLILRPGEESLLADTIDSLAQQFFTGWRLSIFAQTPSPDPEFELNESQVRWFCSSAQALAPCINQQIKHSSGTWFGFFECGMQFSQHLLLACGDYIAKNPNWKMIYTDDDAINTQGKRQSPRFKPDLNPDLLRSIDYIGNFFVEKNALLAAGGYAENPGGEAYDIALRVLDHCGESSIGHIADVLYHVPLNVSLQCHDQAATTALRAHFERRNILAEIFPGMIPGQTRRIKYLHGTCPKVSIIVPNRNQRQWLTGCIDSLVAQTRYSNWEILIVDNSDENAALDGYYQALDRALGERVRILHWEGEFNLAAMYNLAAKEANGEYLLLLKNDILITQDDWLDVMMSHAQRPEIGIVGARQLSASSGKIQDAGLILGLCGTAGQVFSQTMGSQQPGYLSRAVVDQNYSAVSSSCLLVRNSLYRSVQGFDEEAFQLSCADVDFCLKIQNQGFRVIWTPFATVCQNDSMPGYSGFSGEVKQQGRILQDEAHSLAKRWLPRIANDPAWNRNLSLSSLTPMTEGELVASWNPDFHDRPRVLWMPLQSPGQAEYRNFAPMRALHENALAQCAAICQPKPGHDRAPTPFELARLAPDTLVMHAPVDDARCIGLLHYKEINSDILRVYSLDDLITNIPTASYVHKSLPSALVAERLRLGLAASDRLIVSTEPLAEAYRGLIDDIRVIPNTLDGKLWSGLSPRRRQGSKLRVGWVGAQQHAGDLQFMLEVIKATHTEVDWIFFGMMPDGAQPYLAEFHDFVHRFAHYPTKLASLDLDLALAPLEINAFNEAKSNLRLLEYGILGWPVICTDIHPYRTDNPPVTRLTNEPSRWIAAIRSRINESQALAREGESLREWVKQNYLMENNMNRWLKALTR